MKVSMMSLSNRLQVVETILDSNVQKSTINRDQLKFALRIIRSAQRTLYGKHYVEELSLTRYIADPTGKDRDSKQNWRKWKRTHPKGGRLLT